jgi:hypothetical protein
MSRATQPRLIQPDHRHFRIIRPYAVRRAGEPHNKAGIAMQVFPIAGQNAFNFEEMLDVLGTLQARWLDASQFPPPELEPWAEAVSAVDPVDRTIDINAARPHGCFTLHAWGRLQLNRLASKQHMSFRGFVMSRHADVSLGSDQIFLQMIAAFRHTLAQQSPSFLMPTSHCEVDF